MTITQGQDDYAKEVEKIMKSRGLRTKTDLRNEKLGFKVREAQLQKVPYMLILGEQEMKTRTVSVRLRSGTEIKNVPLEKFVETVVHEVKTRAKVQPTEFPSGN